MKKREEIILAYSNLYISKQIVMLVMSLIFFVLALSGVLLHEATMYMFGFLCVIAVLSIVRNKNRFYIRIDKDGLMQINGLISPQLFQLSLCEEVQELKGFLILKKGKQKVNVIKNHLSEEDQAKLSEVIATYVEINKKW